ncbi:DUF262 domain-containing protein [Nocardia salmonicida]|uniref:HNH endonuclease family protein n=1 Tax=Nocardia salmonicida TaxID=53431 RepID=UPI003407370E
MDSLIPREDFEAIAAEISTTPSSLSTTLRLNDLGPESLIYNVLRKPDFQRETGNWTPDKVAELVSSFVEGDLIPSVILWRSPESGKIFVIDGAHRLSALIAWVHDDYGDSHVSRRFFDNSIPAEQIKAADATRKLIADRIGAYADLGLALRNSDTAPEEKLRIARNLGAFAINLQWVVGEAEKAESSFFRINQKATPIDQTELDMIKARRKPNAVAARAFIRAGTGNKYWSKFPAENQSDIENLGREVYDLIFKPDLDPRITTADLPVAGRGYSADSLKMVFELVNFVNDFTPEMWRDADDSEGQGKKAKNAPPPLADDDDGEATVRCMRAVRRSASRIAGNDPASLGLHPAVYFYTATGLFQPAAFLAAIAFVRELYSKHEVAKFTSIRAAFEEFLVEHKHFFNLIVRRYGSMHRAVPAILEMHRTIYRALSDGEDTAGAIERLKAVEALKTSLQSIDPEGQEHGQNFSKATKNAVILKSVIAIAPKCGICNARVNLRSVTFDHIHRKEDGGTGAPSNAQLAHPYCNSGYKESNTASARVQASLFEPDI